MVIKNITEIDSVIKTQLAGHFLLRTLKDFTDTTLAAKNTGNQGFFNLATLAGSKRIVGG